MADVIDRGAVKIELIEITHDSAGLRLALGQMGVRFTVRGGGHTAAFVLPLLSAAYPIGELIRDWARDPASIPEEDRIYEVVEVPPLGALVHRAP